MPNIDLRAILLSLTVAIFVIAVSGLWAVQREINASERAARVLDYADSVTTLVHELQVERGLSTGHVAAS
ncbi:MAG: hypothetical protein AAF390_16375, partial [Pseudomonadota bacterium]